METNNNMKDFNIAEALKNAPKGLKLYSPLLGEVRLEKVSDHDDTIVVTTKYKSERVFFEDGKYDSNGECLLFPSKDHREWNHWQNILFPKSIGSACVHNITGNKFILGEDGTYFDDNTGNSFHFLIDDEDSGNYLLNSRYATPEETKEFFEELDKNGYEWNGETVVRKKQNKPKFHEGDWITHNIANFVFKVVSVGSFGYEVVNRQNFKKTIPLDSEDKYHLWTIQDAKPGDVLYLQHDEKEHIIIYKGIIKERFRTFVSAYCAYNGIIDAFCFTDVSRYTDTAYGGIMPATKEQRDFLFQKMHEAGFEWNADTKKLTKTTIPIPKFKEGDVIKHTPTGEIAIIKHICSDYYVLDKGTSLYFESQDMWELVASKVNPSLGNEIPTAQEVNYAANNMKSFEDKVSVLADEILALKQRVLALEIQMIKDMSTPPLTVDPYFKSNKITCDDAQSLQGKKASDYNPLTTTTKKEGEQKCL